MREVLLNTQKMGLRLALSQRRLICRESFGFQKDLKTVIWASVLLSEAIQASFLKYI